MQKNPNIKLILDTHVFLWLMNGEKDLSEKSKAIILKAVEEGTIGLSAISLWEISMLSARKRIFLNQPCLNWIERSLEAPGIILCPLSPEIVVESSSLPEAFHGDPADRMIVATARILGVPLMTRDDKILKYSENTWLNCIEA
jgi:PIN domain nuclease of toxin-antitoxin system